MGKPISQPERGNDAELPATERCGGEDLVCTVAVLARPRLEEA